MNTASLIKDFEIFNRDGTDILLNQLYDQKKELQHKIILFGCIRINEYLKVFMKWFPDFIGGKLNISLNGTMQESLFKIKILDNDFYLIFRDNKLNTVCSENTFNRLPVAYALMQKMNRYFCEFELLKNNHTEYEFTLNEEVYEKLLKAFVPLEMLNAYYYNKLNQAISPKNGKALKIKV